MGILKFFFQIVNIIFRARHYMQKFLILETKIPDSAYVFSKNFWKFSLHYDEARTAWMKQQQ
jgi:hypothetical protein